MHCALLPSFLDKKAKAVSHWLWRKVSVSTLRCGVLSGRFLTSTEAKHFLRLRLTSVCVDAGESQATEAKPGRSLSPQAYGAGQISLQGPAGLCWEGDRGPRGILEPSTEMCPKQWLKCVLNKENNSTTPSRPQTKTSPKNTERSWLSHGAAISILIAHTCQQGEQGNRRQSLEFREMRNTGKWRGQ